MVLKMVDAKVSTIFLCNDREREGYIRPNSISSAVKKTPGNPLVRYKQRKELAYDEELQYQIELLKREPVKMMQRFIDTLTNILWNLTVRKIMKRQRIHRYSASGLQRQSVAHSLYQPF